MTDALAGVEAPVILAPNVAGLDGIAAVVRQAIRAWADGGERCTEVWSLLDNPDRMAPDLPPARYRCAAGHRARFSARGFSAVFRGGRRPVALAMHLSLAPVALPLALRGSALAIFLHGVEAWRPVRRLEAIAIRRAGLLIANSECTAQRFRTANPQFASRAVAVCPLGIELPRSAPNAPDGGACPAAPAAPVPFALIVGRMAAEERYKGHDLLIDVWPEVVSRVPDARLVVAGDGDDRRRLEAKSAASPAADAMTFLGRVDDGRLHGLYRDCSLFVMPSRGEGFGLVFLEAMHAGKACVAGAGAAAEVVQDGVTGFVIDPGDRGALVNAVVRLFAEPSLAAAMGAAGAQRVRERFGADRFRARLRELVSTLGGGR